MKRLTIFSLEAVIRYSENDLRRLLFELLKEHHSIKIKEDPAPEIHNFEGLLNFIFKSNLDRKPNKEERQFYRKSFKSAIKKLYLEDEDSFEVRPGVQSLFNHLEKEKRWKYGIISDFWEDSTKFILQSCGIFSKGKWTIYAEEAEARKDQVDILVNQVKKEEQEQNYQFIALNSKPKFLSEDFKVIRPKASNKESNYYIYPKFSELFGIKRKKRSKVN